ncbi:MAG: sugar phosphate isomerase/epimerase [Verrucomicrobiota bacterium]
MKISFHTDAFNTSFVGFDRCLEWARDNDVHWIECGLIDGVSWIHGLGYQPHIAMYQDPALLRKHMASYGVRFSQVDAAFPLSGVDGPAYGLPYVLKAIPWAKHAGCERVATTDGLHRPDGLTDEEAMDLMKRQYQRIIEVAEAYEMIVTIEVHGYFTTKPELLERMLAFVDSPFLRLNLDTGNSFIAGQDPVAFCERFRHKVAHVHVKDVSESLAAIARGGQTGIALSQCAVGDGVNASNIKSCLTLLHATGFTGHLSIECEGQGGPMLTQSLHWLRKTLTELGIPEEKG